MKKGERNANTELLRILAMFMVLVVHGLVQSGTLYFLSPTLYFVYWPIRTLFVVSIDCFVLISGYFMVTGRLKLERIAKLGG